MKSQADPYDFTWALYALLGIVVYFIGLKI